MRAPSATLVVDAAILVSAAFGRSRGAILAAQRAAVLITTERAIQETRRRVELGLKRPDLLTVIDALTETMTVVPIAALMPLLERSEIALRDAPASRNGSTSDAHLLALAWSTGADIWTTDRDFAGTGVATWSTPNLMRGFAEAANGR